VQTANCGQRVAREAEGLNMDESASDHARRLDEVEIRLAHQDRVIAELNEVITAQWRTIDALERRLSDTLDELGKLAPQRDGPEPPPPHY